MCDNMIEFIVLNEDENELWEIDYEKKIALNVSDLGIVKNKVINYTGNARKFFERQGFQRSTFSQ